MRINKVEVRKLWLEGLLDTEIAECLNCAEITIKRWRQQNNLKSNYAISRSEKNPISPALLTKLWENGLTDSEIAKELNCAAVTIWRFREKNGMGSNTCIFDWKKERKI